MGRIEKALKHAKESHDRAGRTKDAPENYSGSSRGATANQTDTATETSRVFSTLSDAATTHILDPQILRENRVTTDEQNFAIRSAYKMLRTRLLQRIRANCWNSMAISSARSSAGKTLTAINTSISIAHEPCNARGPVYFFSGETVPASIIC